MFGIGLPELILIMAVALIVVGPDKLPELAKTLAKQLLELKKAGQQLKDSFQDEVDKDLKPWEQIPSSTRPPGNAIEDGFELLKPAKEEEQPSGSAEPAPAEEIASVAADIEPEDKPVEKL